MRWPKKGDAQGVVWGRERGGETVMTGVGGAPQETERGDSSGGCSLVDGQELKGSRLRMEVRHWTFWIRLGWQGRGGSGIMGEKIGLEG